MNKIQDADLEGKKVLLRADFNVAIKNGKVTEDFKIKACRETLDYLLKNNCKIALCSHLGRPAAVKTSADKPEGQKNLEFSLEQIKDDVAQGVGQKIVFVDDCIGEKVRVKLENTLPEEVLLLENVRFHEGEDPVKSDDSSDHGARKIHENFSRKLAEPFDVFVNDAFSVCHRDQSSVTGVAKIIPSYAGFWLQKEIEEMDKVRGEVEVPAVAIIGGAKIETKLPVIKFFENIYDNVLVGGKIANEAIDQKIEFSEKVILPSDFVDDRLDIGPDSVEKYKEIIQNAKTIVWNGPMGKFEDEKYYKASKEIADAIFLSDAYSVVGGGETVVILEKENGMDKVDFVSTGGGAMLEYLSGNNLPGIEVLK